MECYWSEVLLHREHLSREPSQCLPICRAELVALLIRELNGQICLIWIPSQQILLVLQPVLLLCQGAVSKFKANYDAQHSPKPCLTMKPY